MVIFLTSKIEAFGRIEFREPRTRITKKTINIGPMEDEEKLRRSVRNIMKVNGRPWESPEKYSGELTVVMQFENRPDLDRDMIERVTARSMSEVGSALRSLKEKWQKVYQEHIKLFLEDSNGGTSYKINFQNKKQMISKSSSVANFNYRQFPVSQPVVVAPSDPRGSPIDPVVTPQDPTPTPMRSADLQESSRKSLERLCEGNHEFSRFSRFLKFLCN